MLNNLKNNAMYKITVMEDKYQNCDYQEYTYKAQYRGCFDEEYLFLVEGETAARGYFSDDIIKAELV